VVFDARMFRPDLGALCLALLAVAGGCGRPSAPVAPAAPAMRAYRGPVTGAFGEPPPGVAPAAAPRARPALIEEAAPGGGRMIRLRGAFRSEMSARGTATSCAAP